MSIINSNNLTKKFKDKLALSKINLQINEGEIHAILGKNGAGKSTFIKIILGLIYPSSGSVQVLGKLPGIENKRIGYLAENITLYPHLSAIDNIKVASYLSNKRMSNNELDLILSKVNLLDAKNKASREFSLGMKRRLQLAMTLLINDDLPFVILDEPTNGLDINGLLWFKNLLKQYKKDGKTILLASHSITDLQDYITNYTIIDKGEIIKTDNWASATASIKRTQICFQKSDISLAISVLKDNNISFNLLDSNIVIDTEYSYRDVSKILYECGLFPESVDIIHNKLEDIFTDLVGKDDENI